MYNTAVRRVGVKYGWFELVVVGGICLMLLWTYFQCVPKKWDWDFHLHDWDNGTNVTVTASPGFLSLYPEILGDDDAVQVTSNSSVPVDVTVKAGDGRDLFTCVGLMPGEYFTFEYLMPCTVVASAS